MHQRRSLPDTSHAASWRARAAACFATSLIGLTLASGIAFATEKPKAPLAKAKSAPGAAPVSTPVPDWPLGSERARVTLIEYGSLTCSHCADFNNNVLPSLRASHIDTGRVRYVFRAFPTPPMGLSYPMHSLARCAGPKGYHRVLDAFFRKQREIFDAAQQGTGAKDAVYAIFSEASGMTANQADICLQTQAYAEAVNQQSAKGESMGVQGTPTLFIQTSNGVKLVAPPYDAESVGRTLDEAIAALPPPVAKPAKAKAKSPAKAKPKAKAKRP